VEEARQHPAVIREVSRFGHAAKVWVAIWVAFSVFFLWFAITDWRDALGVFALMSALFGANLWIQMSQRVWYDDRQVCTKILGKGRECIAFSDIETVSASHSWKRAAVIRPVSELQIFGRSGRTIAISLRHVSLPEVQDMVDEIHRRTGLPVPELRKSVR
jgi:hypothetical protein